MPTLIEQFRFGKKISSHTIQGQRHVISLHPFGDERLTIVDNPNANATHIAIEVTTLGAVVSHSMGLTNQPPIWTAEESVVLSVGATASVEAMLCRYVISRVK